MAVVDNTPLADSSLKYYLAAAVDFAVSRAKASRDLG
jgi:hypothetical protein